MAVSRNTLSVKARRESSAVCFPEVLLSGNPETALPSITLFNEYSGCPGFSSGFALIESTA
uniref:Uncharacterized protein n=1 Tax=Anguilla anguilla TaxID=7936 RepID=A0A0E9S095_ANGAN